MLPRLDPGRICGSYRPMRPAFWLSVFATCAPIWACAPRAALPAQPPPTEAGKTEWKPVEPAKQKVPLVAEPKGLPPADAACQEYLSHSSAECKQVAASNGAAREA